MTSTTFTKINDIFECKLILEDNSEYTIPLREDGYIHATKLCQVAGKRITRWKESIKTQGLITSLIARTNYRITDLIEVHQGGNNQGTWVHPDLGINLAQWCSPTFSLQVSKWIRELIYTDKVEIGKEKSEEEIKQHYENLLTEANTKLEQTENKLNQAENIIISQKNENQFVLKKYKRIELNHQSFLRRKELYKLKEGTVVYLLNMIGLEDDLNTTTKYKVGMTGDITDRVSGFRTANPFCKLLFLMYTPQNSLIEKCMKVKYEKELYPRNSEFISGIPIETLINDIKSIADSLNIPYTVECDEELDKFNNHNIPIEEVKEDEIMEVGKRRCGGTKHLTEESRILSFDNFFKNASNRDGYARNVI